MTIFECGSGNVLECGSGNAEGGIKECYHFNAIIIKKVG
jgi:hypothetical protein